MVGFYAALLSASMEHPGHAILAQKIAQEGEKLRHVMSKLPKVQYVYTIDILYVVNTPFDLISKYEYVWKQ